ncbi:MAG: hypothetical protein IJB90_00590 [Clostridia bacterium]|nr:hypothetical protein [Clostridia bacterium]
MQKTKLNANAVGATNSRPHFEEMTLNNQNGITLIALIITIIVMLILVGVTINVALNGGLFEKAEIATKETEEKAILEEMLSMMEITNDGKIDAQAIIDKMKEKYTVEGSIPNITITGKLGKYNYELSETGIKSAEEVNEAEIIAEAVFNLMTAQNEEDALAVQKVLEQYDAEIELGNIDSYKRWLHFNDKENNYWYLIRKDYMYKISESGLEYIESGTDENLDAILEKVLGLKSQLESKILGQKVEDIRAKYDTNELEEYLLDGYEIDLYEIYMYNDGELALRTNDLFPNTSITAFSEDGVTYSFVSSVLDN